MNELRDALPAINGVYKDDGVQAEKNFETFLITIVKLTKRDNIKDLNPNGGTFYSSCDRDGNFECYSSDLTFIPSELITVSCDFIANISEDQMKKFPNSNRPNGKRPDNFAGNVFLEVKSGKCDLSVNQKNSIDRVISNGDAIYIKISNAGDPHFSKWEFEYYYSSSFKELWKELLYRNLYVIDYNRRTQDYYDYNTPINAFYSNLEEDVYDDKLSHNDDQFPDNDRLGYENDKKSLKYSRRRRGEDQGEKLKERNDYLR